MFQEVEGSRFQTNRHMKEVWLSDLSSCLLNHQEILLVLNSVIDRVDPRAIVRPEGLYQWKFAMTASGKRLKCFRLPSRSRWELQYSDYYATSSGNSLPMFWDKLSVPSRVKTPKGMRWKRLENAFLISSTTTPFQGTQTENTLTHSRLISTYDIFLNRLKLGNAERRQKVPVYPDRISE